MNLLKDEDGQAIVLFAAVMGLVALGFLAFALDVGMLFRQKRIAQSAADAVALAAAENVANSTGTNEQTVANEIAKMNGFDTTLAKNPATVTLLNNPKTGNFVGSSYVQATVSKPVPTLFLAAFSHNFSNMTVSATAIAGGSQTSQTCVCVEGQSGETVNMSNGSKISAPNCGVVVNSSSSDAIGVVGSTLTAQTLGIYSPTWTSSGNINNGGSIAPSTLILQPASSRCTPTMPTAPAYSGCVADPGGGSSSFTAGPATASGIICYKSLTIGANNSLETLNPGTYVITTGSLHFESGNGGRSNLGGNGVFFYLTGTASLLIDNGANINLVAGGNSQNGGGTAPTVGNYNGILIYQDPSDTADMSIQGGASAFMNGALYAPSSAVTLGNGDASTVEGGVVASSLTMYGGGTLTANAATNEGSLSYGSSPKLVQ